MVRDFETTIQRCSPHTLCFPLVTLDLFSLCQSLLIVKCRVLGKHYLGFLLNSSWAQYRVFGTLHFLFFKIKPLLLAINSSVQAYSMFCISFNLITAQCCTITVKIKNKDSKSILCYNCVKRLP